MESAMTSASVLPMSCHCSASGLSRAPLQPGHSVYER